MFEWESCSILSVESVTGFNRVQTLGSNKVDRQRAARTPEIREAYDMALAVLLGDI